MDDIRDLAGAISYEEQIKVFNSLNPELFDEIWYYRTDYVPSLGDSLKSIHYKQPGNYLDFLKSVGENDQAISKYFENFTLTSDVSPYLLGYTMLDSLLEFNLRYERTRLIIAINYLTLNEALYLNVQL